MVAGLIRFELPPIVVTLADARLHWLLCRRLFLDFAIVHSGRHPSGVLRGRGEDPHRPHGPRLSAAESDRFSGIAGGLHCFGQFQFLRVSCCSFWCWAWRRSRAARFANRANAAYSPARIAGAQRDGAIGRRGSIRFARDPGHHWPDCFSFLPRTARAAFQHLVSHRYHLAGFSNHVTLGEIGEIKQENVPVMHVKMDRPEDRTLALKWRGAALSEFNGRAWFNRPAAGQILQPDRAGLLRLDDEVAAPRRPLHLLCRLSERPGAGRFVLRRHAAIPADRFAGGAAPLREITAPSSPIRARCPTRFTAVWIRPSPADPDWCTRCRPLLAKPFCNCRAWTRASAS